MERGLAMAGLLVEGLAGFGDESHEEHLGHVLIKRGKRGEHFIEKGLAPGYGDPSPDAAQRRAPGAIRQDRQRHIIGLPDTDVILAGRLVGRPTRPASHVPNRHECSFSDGYFE